MRRYHNNRPSNIQWLGEIPQHWKTLRLKFAVGLYSSNVDKKSNESEEAVSLCNYIDVYKNEYIVEGLPFMRATAPDNQVERFTLFAGDVLVTKDSEDPKDIAVPAFVKQDLPGVLCGYHLALLRPFPETIDGEYLFRLFQSKSFNSHFEIGAKGITRYGLSLNVFQNAVIPIPTLSEQRVIARFLDHKTRQIDTAIAKLQRLIELLQEERAAVINEAVTKGINLGVPMKDSGVEWIGEVPAHWEVSKMKYVTNKIIDTEHKTVHYIDDGDYLVVRTSNVREGQLILEKARYTDYEGYKEWTRRGIPQPGDILFTREAPAGEACIVPEDTPLCLGQRMVLLAMRKNLIYPEFCVYSIYGGAAAKYIRILSQGSTVSHFNMADIYNIPVLLPPLEIQKEILEYLKVKIAEIDTEIETFTEEISLLQEYRQSLISEVVTGKIDVRDYPIPEEENGHSLV